MSDIAPKEKFSRYWKYFWGTIIIFAIVYIIANITVEKKFSKLNRVDREARLSIIINQFQSKYPQFIKITKELNIISIEKIQEKINISIDKAFEPLYPQIENFSEFHFSITGEYTELFTALFGEIDNILKEQLFEPVNFDELLNNELENINNETLKIIKIEFKEMKNTMQNDMNLEDEEITFLLEEILEISQEDMKYRMKDYTNNAFKGMGLGIGTGTGIMITKVISKQIATTISKKIATKAAIKGGTKIASVAAGAALGATEGLLCGPAAWLCSPAGAIVGGTIGWFASDKIVIEIDEYYHKEDFQQEIQNLIDTQKQATKNTLIKIYTNSMNQITSENQNSLSDMKNKMIKDIISEEIK